MYGKALLAASLVALTLAPAHTAALPNVTVTVVNFAFAPTTVTVQLHGLNTDTITWTNVSPSTHRPHADNHGGAGEGVCLETGNIGPGGAASAQINAACALASGLKIAYHCHIHPGMRGTINIVLA